MAVAKGPSAKLVYTESFEAGADLSAQQFRFVKLSADRTVIAIAAITDKPAGVLQNKPASGETAIVLVVGRSLVDSDSALAAGDLIGVAADGQADTIVPGTDTTVYIAGMVTLGSGAAGQKAEAMINCASPSRAS